MTLVSSPSLKTIYLHGDLKDKYGDSFKLAVNTVREACNALAVMIPGFRQSVVGEKRDKAYRVIRGDLDSGFDMDEEMVIGFHIGKASVHIVPVIQGSKDQGIGKIIFGALLFGAGALMGFGSGFTMTGVAATTGVQVARLGVGLMLAGVGQMLSPSPGAISSESPERRESFLFNGPVNRATQGLPVPLCYGKFLVGSVTVSAGIETDDVVVSDVETSSIPAPTGLYATFTYETSILRATWQPVQLGYVDKNRFYKITVNQGDIEVVSDMIPIPAVGGQTTSFETAVQLHKQYTITVWTAVEMVAGSGKYQYSKPVSTSLYTREPREPGNEK